MTEGKRPVCVVEKAKLKVDRNKYFLVITDLGELQFQYVRGCNDALY
jgi:hypothetical protein